MEIIFATHNINKLKEIRAVLTDGIKLLTLSDINYHDEIPEPYQTLEENSLTKAETIFQKTEMSVIAEDTGLEVIALNNKPGVYSARYAGDNASSEMNIKKLLKEMQGISNREARFRTILTFILENEKKYQFEGIVEGTISTEPLGNNGFGYDSVFIPENHTKTFGQLDESIKKEISHRTRAVNNFVNFLKQSQVLKMNAE